MYKYDLIVYWSDDDAFIIEVPELPRCMADGKTIGEATANVETIIREWIETTKERGQEVPEPEKDKKDNPRHIGLLSKMIVYSIMEPSIIPSQVIFF